jgi:hypothetical protein
MNLISVTVVAFWYNFVVDFDFKMYYMEQSTSCEVNK